MFFLLPLPNNCSKCAAFFFLFCFVFCFVFFVFFVFFVPSLPEKIDKLFFYKIWPYKVLLLTLVLSLYAIGVYDSTRDWINEIECLYEIYSQSL